MGGIPSRNIDMLTTNQITQLDEIGFAWNLWNFQLNELKEFKRIHGHCNAPYSSSLYKWVCDLRRQKENQEKEFPSRNIDVLTNSQITQLDEIGFVWSLWNLRLNELKEFK